MSGASGPAGLVVRPCEEADRPHLQAIRETAFRPVFASFRRIVGPALSPLALGAAEREQAAHLDDLCSGAAMLLVVALGGTPVGFCARTVNGATRVGEIGLNAVHPDHARQGVATRVYAQALDGVRVEGALVTEVSTGGDESHAPARRAYAKAGFDHPLPSVTLYRAL